MSKKSSKSSKNRPSHLPYFGVFDLFKIGIGPSSSHSVGPMRAAASFLAELRERDAFDDVMRIQVDLYGSLALTGLGHATDTAILMGLEGETPDQVDVEAIPPRLQQIRSTHKIMIGGEREIDFQEQTDLLFNRRMRLDAHPNGMRFQAFASGKHALASSKQALASGKAEQLLHDTTYFSVGGGFVVRADELGKEPAAEGPVVPYPFTSAAELLAIASEHSFSLSQIARANELAFRTDQQISDGIQEIWQVMQMCVERGIQSEGILPGGLGVVRRAPSLFRSLNLGAEASLRDPMSILDWVNLYALAVNEENAAGGRVVTAPTNGAAGIIPAVLHYFVRFCNDVSPEKIERFFLTAALIGSLYKRNASISGAEVGCQGEVGVACSMAAGALTEVLGGTPCQVEEAAEIGMEHNLGLTCDPIKGLVQVPCIERNAMGAVKAINASRLALRGDGKHFVSLDRVIRVMKRTGADMSSRYKETSQGGLAVNIAEC